ncbi:prolyl oligopeptidase family serine peptidase [Pelomonas sp. CA6]|uniref:S9 family peptidase n=1 Tax=Pelomonas sp. CA6 TaxID=2907999 RepID=UPI001F4A7C45|nr:prolyl oligopeptidase family serine peptidase [Pelomonas sp. CA6]MCH7342676.1 prolyl oligopeptidase family serine peptidase [Pelomonas sp. CA6]
MSTPVLRPLVLALSLSIAGAQAWAQPPAQPASAAAEASSSLAYQQPSAAMRAVLDAKALPQTQLSPDQRTLATLELRRYRSVAELARPVLKLGGLRFDPATDSPQLTAQIDSLTLKNLADGSERRVELPAGGAFHQLRFSPDGQRFLLNRRTDQAVELWVGDVGTGQLRPIPKLRLHTMLDAHVVWLNAHELVTLAVPARRGPAPSFAAPSGPAVQESMGKVSPEYTLQDLLSNPQDEAVFAHHAQSQMVRVDLARGGVREIGEPGLYAEISAVGTGQVLLVERLLQPFSYRVRWNDFAREVELRDASGKLIKSLGRIKLKEGVPVEGVITGPRQFWASPAADGAVYWVEALDGGDLRNKVSHRDRLMRLDAPYQGEPREVHRTAQRLTGFAMLEGGRQALVTDFDRGRLWITQDLLSLGGEAAPRRLAERSMRDRYRDPGMPLTRMQPNGRVAVRVDGGSIWLVGAGASAEGEKPFLDRLNLADAKTTRVFQSGRDGDKTWFERPLAVLDAQGSRILTQRESFTEPANVMLRSGAALGEMKALTAVKDPTPQLRNIRRELVRFKRQDGVELSFWLYLPPDYKAGERRPAFVWAYPLEYTDAATASQVSGAANRFNTFGGSSPLMLLLDGYVVLMDATMPVVGDPKTVNDSFIAQITANAQAIIDKADELGVADRHRMVVGGHSYGAFMTANLLAHTDLFKAGIARSGAYNRTLTPFGFQSERRTYWEAQDVYLRLSPFNYADKLKEPLLLIHGDSDNNPGTFPLQSQRLYQALAGTGGNVRYVSLPFESHGYSARESIGHTLWEMSEWMKRQVGAP